MVDSGTSVWNDRWVLRPADIKELWTMMGTLNMSSGPGSQVVWRGMASDKFRVESSLIRALKSEQLPFDEYSVRAAEQDSLQNARNWGIGVSGHGHATALHVLAMLQHHGVPTRLIDVTYNPLTALWFACSNAEHQTDPGVLVGFMVSGTAVMKTVHAEAEQTWDSADDPYGYAYTQSLEETVDKNLPILVEPAVRDARMVAQEGLFITSGVPQAEADGMSPVAGIVQPKSMEFREGMEKFFIDEQYATPQTTANTFGMLGIVISPQIKEDILPVLNGNFNRSHRTMYPDLAGFAAYDGMRHVREFEPDI